MSPDGGDQDGAVVVVGFRVTGRAVAGFLSERGDRVVIVEDDPTEERRRQAAALGFEFVATPGTAELRRVLRTSRLVVPSPGIPVRHELDPTGAGDTMLAGVLAARLVAGVDAGRGRDTLVGAIAAGLLVERPGLDAVPALAAIRDRAAGRSPRGN